jgi:DnaJ homologue, subfamily C, member 28, conserved domain
VGMTERKPPGMSTQDWVRAQVQQAANAGEFDNLSLAGKPLTKLAAPHDPDWWVKDFIRREQIEADALLPPAVLLRKEKQKVQETVARMRRESEVRDYLADLNKRILVSIRDTTGPVVPAGTVDEEAVLAQWRAERPEPARPQSVAEAERPAKKSFWQRLFS